MKRFISKAITGTYMLISCGTLVHAQDFKSYFTEKTMRIDYTFSGNAEKQDISVDKLNVMPGWHGKHKRLAELPVEGNGQITVRSRKDGRVIYRNSFSTLFQEWITYPEARHSKQSFENVFLIPMPLDTVDVTVDLRNNRREVTATLTHTVIPSDILIRHIGERNITPYTTLQAAADTTSCIDIAYIAEGYTEGEMETFIADARIANEAMFAHEPFKSMRDRFNVIAVRAASEESGTSIPSKGIWKKTALSSHFDTFYSQRYLTTLNIKDLHDLLAGTPYEHIIVLVHTDHYGGGCILNSYNLSMTHHPAYKSVVVHEFGHSFGGLADEYAYENEPLEMYPRDIEPWEPNITTLKDIHGKWENMITKGTAIPTPVSKDENTIKNKVGLFEGAGYSLSGVYRGVQDCRMRTNENPEFCIVCRNALTKLIDFYTK